jgi:hypothetical protein
MILRLLRASEPISTAASLEYSTSFGSRNTRSLRIMIRSLLPTNGSDSQVGRIASRSIKPKKLVA